MLSVLERNDFFNPEKRPDLQKKYSLINYLTKDTPPQSVGYGTKDPLKDMIDYCDRAEEMGLPIKRLVIEGASHGFALVKDADDIWKEAFSKWCKFPVFFTERFPEGICGQSGEGKDTEWHGRTVALNRLAQAVKEAITSDFVADKDLPWLRYNHFRSEEGDYYFLHNESRLEQIKFRVEMDTYGGHCYRVDVMTGKVCATDSARQIVMEPFEAQLYFIGKQLPEEPVPGFHDMQIVENFKCGEEKAEKEQKQVFHEGRWEIKLWNGEEQVACLPDSSLININGKDAYPEFAGKIVYRSEVEFGERLPKILDLGTVYEACDVYWNGEFAGSCISTPYRVEIGKLVRPGVNKVVIEVYNSEARDKGRETMPLSMISGTVHTFLEPGGLLGPVKYC